jgi:hypothetical protein
VGSAFFLTGVAVGIVIGVATAALALVVAALAAGRLFVSWVVKALP